MFIVLIAGNSDIVSEVGFKECFSKYSSNDFNAWTDLEMTVRLENGE